MRRRRSLLHAWHAPRGARACADRTGATVLTCACHVYVTSQPHGMVLAPFACAHVGMSACQRLPPAGVLTPPLLPKPTLEHAL